MSHLQTTTQPPPAHVLIFPMPLQGHVNPMLHLAEILCLSGLHVTVLLSEHVHTRLLRHSNLQSRFSRYPGFRVTTIADGLPADHPRVGEQIMDILLSLKQVGEPQFRSLFESNDGTRPRVSCVIMDGVFSFAIPVVEENGVPYIYFRTSSACAFWAYFRMQDIIDAGEIPFKGKNGDKWSVMENKEMDLLVTSLPGMEGFLRRRDLPGFCRVNDINEPGFQAVKNETKLSAKANALILNTFEDLDGPILDQIRNDIPNLYSIGPLHIHLKAWLEEKGIKSLNHSSSFWNEDRGCMTWLDKQPAYSVIYVNFGSVTILTRNELLEFWFGLVNSGVRFLWVIRPDSIVGDYNLDDIPVELREGTEARGCMVEWVPQQEVLGHSAVGAFFTHSGWNSTLESITIGVPMLCWSYFADQTTNSRMVSEVWKIGLDMKDTCDRNIIEKMVKDIMEVRRDEFLERAQSMSKLAKEAVSEGRSSYANLNRLIEFLKSTTT